MNHEPNLEHEITSAFTETAPVRPPEHLLQSAISQARRTRRSPRWLALIKEPTMHSDAHLTVGSPTARVTAVIAATFLLAGLVAGAGIAGSRLLAADAPIVVDQSDPDAFQTITAAVASAEDGDTILVRPGTYTEAVVIADDIALRGDGPRDEVIIMAPEDGPTSNTGVFNDNTSEAPYAVLLQDSDATLSGLTFQGVRSQVHANGGSPTLEGLVLDEVGLTFWGNYVGGGVTVTGGTSARIIRNELTGGGSILIYDGSTPLIEGNVLTDGPHIAGHAGDEAVIRGNTVSGAKQFGIALFDQGRPTVEENTVTDVRTGIRIGEAGSNAGLDPRIRGNDIASRYRAIDVTRDALPVIADNQLAGADVGVMIHGSDLLMERNEVSASDYGVFIQAGAPTLVENDIAGGRIGIWLGVGADPDMTGNSVCGEEAAVATAIDVDEPPDMSGNDICPVAGTD